MKAIRKVVTHLREPYYTYWTILIVGFTGFALLIWFGLIPSGIVEYNLGVNLFTSSIFMVLTIFLLSWVITLRERIRWKTVENEVYLDIRYALGEIIGGILRIVEKGLETTNSILSIENKDTRKKTFLSELRRLKDAKEIRLDPAMLRLEFKDTDAPEPFVSVARRLGDIQIKYSRFLSPKLTFSLMRIQTSITLLETVLQLNTTYQKIPKELTKILPLQLEDPEGWIYKSISMSFKRLIEEIYTIHEMGIEVALPYF